MNIDILIDTNNIGEIESQIHDLYMWLCSFENVQHSVLSNGPRKDFKKYNESDSKGRVKYCLKHFYEYREAYYHWLGLKLLYNKLSEESK